MIGQVHGFDAEMAREFTPPTLADDFDLHYLNPITSYLQDTHFKSQSMGVMAVEPSNGTTIWTLMSHHRQLTYSSSVVQ